MKRLRGVYSSERLARRLRAHPPKSDLWFQNEWERLGMRDEADEFNVVFGRFIPDCVNHQYKYVIEVDGKIHEKKFQQKRDDRKNQSYESRGYQVFRLKAYDNAGFEGLCDLITRIRTPEPVRIPPLARVILRKAIYA